MNRHIGWAFCELAFRTWDALPAKAAGPAPECRFVWWARPVNALAAASYRIGCWFYGRAK